MVSGSAWVLKENFLQEAKDLVGTLSSPAGLLLLCACYTLEHTLGSSWVTKAFWHVPTLLFTPHSQLTIGMHTLTIQSC